MNWIDYTKQKPTDKDAQYLVYYEIQHSKGTLKSTQIAQWNGEYFHKYDYEFDLDYKCNDVKYWMKIEEPSADFANADKIALTWQDVKRIVEIADEVLDFQKHGFLAREDYGWSSEEAYYSYVLEKFKEYEL